MAIDSDDLISLPNPPPPRPAARREAIGAALRRFDGIEDTPAQRRRPPLLHGSRPTAPPPADWSPPR